MNAFTVLVGETHSRYCSQESGIEMGGSEDAIDVSWIELA
jgi:hypothetical protein